MEQSLVYVSTRTFPLQQSAKMVGAIVALARTRNASMNVTGALMATENHFAQLLEGPPESIEALMRSISQDPRHRDVLILQNETRANRLFPRWSLAYQGTSPFFESFVRPLIAPSTPLPEDVDRLVDLLTRLVEPNPRPLSRDRALP